MQTQAAVLNFTKNPDNFAFQTIAWIQSIAVLSPLRMEISNCEVNTFRKFIKKKSWHINFIFFFEKVTRLVDEGNAERILRLLDTSPGTEGGWADSYWAE